MDNNPYTFFFVNIHKDRTRVIGTKYQPENSEILFFPPLSVKKKLQEDPLGLRFQREDQGAFGNQQELINQRVRDFQPSEKGKERSLTPSS